MDELKADAEGEGFSCNELTTDGLSVFEIISAVFHVHLLIGVNSAAYNAIFMPISSAVLEIDAKLGGYYKGSHSSGPQSFLTTHIGYHWLGIHLFLYTFGRRCERGHDPTITISLNVTRRALSAMRHKLQQQQTIGCCEVASLHRSECRGSWQLVAKAFRGEPVNLYIPDVHMGHLRDEQIPLSRNLNLPTQSPRFMPTCLGKGVDCLPPAEAETDGIGSFVMFH